MEVCNDCKIVASLSDGKGKLPNQVLQGYKVAKEDQKIKLFEDCIVHEHASESNCGWVKVQYIVHKLLSQNNFCKILEFVIGHVIKYNQLI
jgi:hypothetical protein